MPEKAPKFLFQAGDISASILRLWWEGLEQDRGERAVLKRASNPTEVVFSPAYHRLFGQIQQQGFRVRRESLAAVAGLAAHVKEDIGQELTVAKQMAIPKSQGSGAKVSGLRFRRLLATAQSEELYPLLIRVIRLLDGRVNLLDLANSAYWWNEITRRQWAYDYYAAAPEEK